MQKNLSKSDQAEITKSKLISVATRYFTKHGYAHTASEDIVKASQVTRGALYHHFQSKEGLFMVALEKVLTELQLQLDRATINTRDPFEKLLLFCKTYLHCINQPDVLQISIIDAQTVIGWHSWNDLQERYIISHLANLIEELVLSEIIKPYQALPLAQLLIGGMHSAVMWSVGQKHPDISLAEAEAALEEMILSLRVVNWDTTL